jgi:hypothetical protein
MSILAGIGRRRTRLRAAGLVAAVAAVTLGLTMAGTQAAPADQASGARQR